MKSPRLIVTFNDRYPLLGPAFWISSLQYFIVQLAVALNWATPYNFSRDTISDLGNTACGLYDGRSVCSPLHLLMDLSFIALGLTMIAGSSLIYREFREGRAAVAGFTFMALAGLGSVVVGLFPENTIAVMHTTGALLAFFIGNLGMIILGASLALPKWLRIYTFGSGVVALAALIFFMTGNYLALGRGGMERLTGYPQTVWLVVFGLYMSKKRLAGRA